MIDEKQFSDALTSHIAKQTDQSMAVKIAFISGAIWGLRAIKEQFGDSVTARYIANGNSPDAPF
ncbi:MAG: hypothetical protein ACREGF_04890 [Candidatus Saccharimonadales bacterium]